MIEIIGLAIGGGLVLYALYQRNGGTISGGSGVDTLQGGGTSNDGIASGGVSTVKGYDAIYKKYATAQADWKLLKAIAMVESSERAWVSNPSDPSYGLGQVLCKSNGMNSACTNLLPAVPEFTGATPNKLLDPDYNVKIYSKILTDNIKKYGLERGVATYNRWASRLENPPFTNQSYVDKVLKNYRSL